MGYSLIGNMQRATKRAREQAEFEIKYLSIKAKEAEKLTLPYLLEKKRNLLAVSIGRQGVRESNTKFGKRKKNFMDKLDVIETSIEAARKVSLEKGFAYDIDGKIFNVDERAAMEKAEQEAKEKIVNEATEKINKVFATQVQLQLKLIEDARSKSEPKIKVVENLISVPSIVGQIDVKEKIVENKGIVATVLIGGAYALGR